MTLYIVTATEKHQASWERPNQMEVEAKNKKEAISKARRQMLQDNGGWRSRYDSPISYRAEVGE